LLLQVRAVIGTHGGVFINLMYAVQPTMAVEIWPVSPDGKKTAVPTPNEYWEIAGVRGLQHWAVPVHTKAPGTSDVDVNCSMLVSVLEANLGQEYSDVLEPFYQGTTWSA
jgi:hypothetical protein